ncbi:TetR/AcrR family transcriptional regulator [Actinokineospora sp. 24-640]
MAERMPRAQRRAQLLDAATRAFARTGFAATGLADVAAEAGVTQVILYRHFESKSEMYRAVLERARVRLDEAVGSDAFDEHSIAALLRAASADPDGFRLLFRHAAREPEFRDVVDTLRSASVEITARHLAEVVPDAELRDWAARLLPVAVLEAVIAWLDAGQPDPEQAALRVGLVIDGVVRAAAQPRSARTTREGLGRPR